MERYCPVRGSLRQDRTALGACIRISGSAIEPAKRSSRVCFKERGGWLAPGQARDSEAAARDEQLPALVVDSRFPAYIPDDNRGGSGCKSWNGRFDQEESG